MTRYRYRWQENTFLRRAYILVCILPVFAWHVVTAVIPEVYQDVKRSAW